MKAPTWLALIIGAIGVLLTPFVGLWAYADITPAIARASGFKGVVDLLKVAKHGRGENVYLVRFHYVPPASGAPAGRTRGAGRFAATGRASQRRRE